MNPESKAKELYDKYFIICQEYTEEIQCGLQAKQCAITAVNEILELLAFSSTQSSKYWMDVKKELEKL